VHASSVISKTKALLFIASICLVPLAAGSCASNPPRVNDVQQLNQRLQGVWLLQSYRPNVALEAPLLALVNIQFGQMRVTFNGTQLTAQGPALQVARTYQIQEAMDQTATLIVSEPTGVSVRVRVEFRDNLLMFRPLDAPWSGEGSLQRL
jgi:hypothetical protein